MQTLEKGRWRARLATTDADLRAVQHLRWQCFVAPNGGAASDIQLDVDAMDSVCEHVLIEDMHGDRLAGCFRFLDIPSGAEIDRSYSAHFYDLSALKNFPGPMIEVGRFCVDPDVPNPDVLRIAWAVLTGHVDETAAKLLFGCSSFLGTDAMPYAEAFAMLRDEHIAPSGWLPRIKAGEVVRFSQMQDCVDRRRAMAALPGLLRIYLSLGGWVSDHAVVDRQLNTLHVFTGVEVGSVPPRRARALRALAS